MKRRKEKVIPIPENYINEFELRFQSHSGLSYKSNLTHKYSEVLRIITITPKLELGIVIDKFVNAAMITAHKIYRKTKTWKSYDW